jgi:hypothetical protein
VSHCFIRCPFQGLAGMTGAIYSDNDAGHVNLLFDSVTTAALYLCR